MKIPNIPLAPVIGLPKSKIETFELSDESIFDLDLEIHEQGALPSPIEASGQTNYTCAFTCRGPSCAQCSVRNISCGPCSNFRC